MRNLLVLLLAFISISCSSMKQHTAEVHSPGYQYSKQMDERALKSGFLGR